MPGATGGTQGVGSTQGADSSSAAGSVPEALATHIPRSRLFVLFSVTLAGVSGPTVIPPSIPAMADSLGVSATTGALVLSVYTLPGVVVAPVIGFLADRFGRKAVMLPALVLHGLGGGLCTFAPDFKTLLFLRFIQGIGSAGLVNLVVVTIGDLLEGVTRARYIGYNAAVLTVGTASFPSLGGVLASRNWRLAYLPFWAVLGVALAIAAVLPNTRGSPERWLPADTAGKPSGLPTGEAKGDTGEASSRESSGGGAGEQRTDSAQATKVGALAPTGFFSNIRAVLSVPGLRRIMLRGFVLFVLIYGGILAAVPVMLEERLGVAALTIGVFLTAGSVASMIMSSLGGRLRERMSPPRILLVAFASYTVGMMGLAAASEVALRPLAFVAIAACGIGEGMSIVVLQTRATEVAPAGLRGTSVAMFVSSARLGQTTGPLAAKLALDKAGFTLSFLAFGAVAVLMSIEQVRRVRKTEGASTFA